MSVTDGQTKKYNHVSIIGFVQTGIYRFSTRDISGEGDIIRKWQKRVPRGPLIVMMGQVMDWQCEFCPAKCMQCDAISRKPLHATYNSECPLLFICHLGQLRSFCRGLSISITVKEHVLQIIGFLSLRRLGSWLVGWPTLA